MSGYRVLAHCASEPIFLVTPSGPSYINELEILQITGAEKMKVLAKLNLKQVMISQRRLGLWQRLFSGSGKNEQSLFEAIWTLKNRYKCEIVFQINSQKDIAVATRLPSGQIVSIHLLKVVSAGNLEKIARENNYKVNLSETPLSQYEAIEVTLEGQDQELQEDIKGRPAS